MFKLNHTLYYFHFDGYNVSIHEGCAINIERHVEVTTMNIIETVINNNSLGYDKLTIFEIVFRDILKHDFMFRYETIIDDIITFEKHNSTCHFTDNKILLYDSPQHDYGVGKLCFNDIKTARYIFNIIYDLIGMCYSRCLNNEYISKYIFR